MDVQVQLALPVGEFDFSSYFLLRAKLPSVIVFPCHITDWEAGLELLNPPGKPVTLAVKLLPSVRNQSVVLNGMPDNGIDVCSF